MKKFIGILILVLTFSALCAGVFCNAEYVFRWMTGKKFYTEAQYNQNYEDGYNKGSNAYPELKKELQRYKDLYANEIAKNETLSNEKQELLNNYNNSLQQYEDLLEIKNALETKGETDEATISNLQAQITSYKNQLDHYIAIYEDVNSSRLLKVTFKNGDETVAIDFVENGGTATNNIEPAKNGYTFAGWVNADNELIDLSTYQITEDTTLTATFEKSAGLFNSTSGKLIKTWDELINEGYFYIDNGMLFTSDNSKTQTLTGELVISNDVKAIGSTMRVGVFYNCSQLTSIIIPNTVTSISYGAFNGCSGLTSLTIPSSVTSIPECAFQTCSSLQNIVLSNNISSIGQFAFSGCRSLQSITISNNVTNLGMYTFGACKSLTTVFIPASVTNMSGDWYEDAPFGGCSSNLVIYCEATAKPSGWKSCWNYIDAEENKLTVKWGYTYEQYLAEINL